MVLYNSSSSSIHLASSLTIETISKNNGGGGNYGGTGTIAIVDNEGTIIETIQEATEYVSGDDPTVGGPNPCSWHNTTFGSTIRAAREQHGIVWLCVNPKDEDGFYGNIDVEYGGQCFTYYSFSYHPNHAHITVNETFTESGDAERHGDGWVRMSEEADGQVRTPKDACTWINDRLNC